MVALEPVQSEAQQAAAERELAAQGKGRQRHLDKPDDAILRELVERHLRFTGSTLALAMLDDWESARGRFVKVFPHEYRRALTEMHAAKAAQAAAVAKPQRAAA
jgi:glutamate synthase (NADPH/NADH) large chain